MNKSQTTIPLFNFASLGRELSVSPLSLNHPLVLSKGHWRKNFTVKCSEL
jgi:hypothetical protein